MSNDFILGLIESKKRYNTDSNNGKPKEKLYSQYKKQIIEKRDVRNAYSTNNDFKKELHDESDFRDLISENKKKMTHSQVIDSIEKAHDYRTFGGGNPGMGSGQTIVINDSVIDLSDKDKALERIMTRLKLARVNG